MAWTQSDSLTEIHFFFPNILEPKDLKSLCFVQQFLPCIGVQYLINIIFLGVDLGAAQILCNNFLFAF